MFPTPQSSSSAAVFIITSCLKNMLLELVVLVPTSWNSCHSWCWNNLLKRLRLAAVTLCISCSNCSITFWRSASDQVITACRALFRHTWNCFRFVEETFQLQTQRPPLQHKSFESFVRVTDGITLPTGHPIWPSQTSTFSVLEKLISYGKIAWEHHPVLWGIDPSDFVD